MILFDLMQKTQAEIVSILVCFGINLQQRILISSQALAEAACRRMLTK